MKNLFSMGRAKEPRLLEILMDGNFISKKDLKSIKRLIDEGKSSLEDILLEYVSSEVLLQARVDEYDRRFIGIDLLKNIEQFNVDVIKLLPIRDAMKNHVVILQKKGDNLAVAMVNPLDDFASHIVERETGLKIAARYVCIGADLKKFVLQTYGLAQSQEVDEQIKKERAAIEVATRGAQTVFSEMESEGMVGIRQIVDALIQKAIDKGASDIHIEPTRTSTGVRYRVDGILQVDQEIEAVLNREKRDKFLHNAIVNIIKNRSGASGKDMRLDEREKPQDGRIYIPHLDLDLRVSIIPSLYGESVVIRLHNREVGEFSLDRLGFEAEDLKKFSRMIKLPYGMILVTGPTGSGKTTTLYSVMQMINSPEKKTLTIEDPIEYSIAGAIQSQTNPAKGYSFDQGLRSFLRHDPDIIMLGEVRDAPTASMAVESALTGHLVLTTLHANDAVSTIPRLKDLGVDPRLITSTVICTMAQRLVRSNCKFCSEKARFSTRIYKALNRYGVPYNTDNLTKGRGCDICKQTGYSGRTGIFELLEMTFDMKEAILKDATVDELEAIARKQGMKTLLEDALYKVANGITTEEEVWRVTLLDKQS